MKQVKSKKLKVRIAALLFAFFLSPIAYRLSPAFAATGCSYPTSLDSFSDVTAGQSLTATLYNKLQCAAEKAEAELGTLPKGTYADVKTRLDDAVYKVGNQIVAGQKTLSDLLTVALGTITADKQNLSLTATWNEGSTVFTAIKLNVTNTASSSGSKLLDLEVDSVAKFTVDRTGVVTATTFSGNATTATALAANPADCAANRFATTIAANGDLTCTQVDLTTSAITGALPIANGGSGQATKTAAFDALSPVTTLGDTIYRDGSNNVRLAGNTTTTKKFLRQTGDGVNSAAPAWDTLVSGDLPSHNHAASDVNSGQIALARGGLNTDISASGALGDLLYADAATTFARKAGNTSATKKILMQTGTGAASAAPAWSLIDTMALLDTGLCTDGQIPKKVTGAWACATDATAGSPSLDTVADPAASKSFSMAAATLAFNWTSATPASTSVFTINDPTNNTGTGDLVDIHTASGSTLKPLRVTAAGTANGVEMSAAGALAAIGSGTITANRTSCTGTDYLKFDGTCAATAASTWSGLGAPTANLALTMGAYTSTFTYNDATSTVSLFRLTDTLNNSGTGCILCVDTASGSTAKPVKFTAAGTSNGVQMDNAGKLAAIGSGIIEAAAGSLTGATLAAGVTASSLTSFGTNPTLNGTATIKSIIKLGESGVQNGIIDTCGVNCDLYLKTNNVTQISIDASGTGGVQVGAPTGGYKGTGTLNATAVYDDNVLLTDWLFDSYFDGKVRPSIPGGNPPRSQPTKSHHKLFSFAEAKSTISGQRRLPWMPSETEFEKERNVGGMISRLWQGQEQQQIYLVELENRIKALEARP